MLVFGFGLILIGLAMLGLVAWREQKEGYFRPLPLLWSAIAVVAIATTILLAVLAKEQLGSAYVGIAYSTGIAAVVAIAMAVAFWWVLRWKGRGELPPPFRGR